MIVNIIALTTFSDRCEHAGNDCDSGWTSRLFVGQITLNFGKK